MATQKRYSLRDVKRTLRKNMARLLAHPNVLYLAIGEKISASTGQKRLAIRVCVSQKKGKHYPGAVPKRLRAVRAGGTLANFFIPTDVEKKPPTLKGLDVRGGDIITGTTLGAVGLAFQGDDERIYILTNAHVTPGINQVAQNQPIRIPGGPIIGHTFRATRLVSAPGQLHTIDAAVVVPRVPVDLFVIDGNQTRVMNFGQLRGGMTQQFFYLRKSGARRVFGNPNLVSTPRTVRMNGHQLLFVNFFEMTLMQGLVPQEGDSGSVLVSDTGAGLVVHGLLFAGAERTIGVMAIQDVFRALTIRPQRF
jgi:hypothetical protein